MIRKKIVLFTSLVLLMLVTSSIPVFAANKDSAGSVGVQSIVVPFYSYISAIGSSLSIVDGLATCSGDFNLFKDYDSSMTITLQRSSNGITWTNVNSWSASFSDTGNNSMEKECYVSSGYTYRVYNTVQIKNGKTVLETASHISPEKQY